MPRSFPYALGWAGPGLPDWRDRLFAARREVLAALPPSVDLTTPAAGPPFDPVYQQGSIGSCGPNSAAGDLCLDLIVEPGSEDPRPSRLFIYWTTRYLMNAVGQDSGVHNRTMLKALAQYGWCDESLWPYVPDRYKEKPPPAAFEQAAGRKIIEFQAVPQDLDQMRGCLAAGEPFIFGFSVYSSMNSPGVQKTGDIPMPTRQDQMQGGHDVLICGYDDSTQRFKLRNSWGAGWGRGGMGSIPYAYATHPRLAADFWRVVKSAYVPPPGPGPIPPEPEPEPLPPTPAPDTVYIPKAGHWRYLGP
jgi:C1A family cysteine protease